MKTWFESTLYRRMMKLVGAVFVIWVMLCAPTGWVYDLGIGRGTRQGQWPDASVVVLHTQDEVEESFFHKTPRTVQKDQLVECPLLHLRDERHKGSHQVRRKHHRSTTHISEYLALPYPVKPMRRAATYFLRSSYNGYYLAPLKDGSYVCVYFDDYLMLGFGRELPVGYVRYASTQEKQMLHTMAKEYDVNPVYVLDLYRHQKMSWTLDYLLRFVAAIVSLMVGMVIFRAIERSHKEKTMEQ